MVRIYIPYVAATTYVVYAGTRGIEVAGFWFNLVHTDHMYVREQHLDDMYRILASASLNPRKPRIIEVSGSFFNVHDPSPTHRTGDLGALPDFIEGDDNFGKMESSS